jgi:transcriptional regulator GlxA family with amidase domain
MEALSETLRARGYITITVVLFNDYELLDVFGPLELFATVATLPHCRGKLKLCYLSVDRQDVQTLGAPTVFADMCLPSNTDPSTEETLDVLFVPGGLGTRKLHKDEVCMNGLRAIAQRALVVMTVCTGSLLLASTNLLDGRIATTNKRAFNMIEETYPNVKWQKSARWCVDGKYYTSSGVSAGMDLAYFFLQELFGNKNAFLTSQLCEYVPSTSANADPFIEYVPVPFIVNRIARTFKVLLVLYDQFEMLDTFGPLEMFAMANKVFKDSNQPPAFDVVTIGEDEVVRSFGGPSFRTDTTFDTISTAASWPKEFDLMLLPGGVGTIREINNPKTQQCLPALVQEQCSKVMTVCTGSAILGSMGLMKGVRATTNKTHFDLMMSWCHEQGVNWVPHARWVADGKFYTSSGVSAGTDLSLALIREAFGKDLALEVAAKTEYVWNADDDGTNDPFAQCIPPATFLRGCFVRFAKTLLTITFRIGFALGLKMRITRILV